MKRISFFLLLFVSAILHGQNLSTVYKNGDVKLIPVSDYGTGNDWDNLFPDYNEKAKNKSPVGKSKHIVVAPDGSVYMSHRSRHSISKFDKNGNFVKAFGKKGGKSPADFIYMPNVEGILDGKYLYTAAVDGRMHFFDLNEKWIKTISLKYMPLKTASLKNGNIAIMGHVAARNGSKGIISILNFQTGKEKIISSEFSPYETKEQVPTIHPYFFTDETGKKRSITLINFGPQFLDRLMMYRPRIATTTNGNLVIAEPKTGLVKILDTNGHVVKQFNAYTEREVITKEDREEYYQNALKKVKAIEADVVKTKQNKEDWDKYIEQIKPRIERLREPEAYPAALPYFSELLVDSENNILLFRYTKEAGSNRFDVYAYDSQGKKIATSRFIADGYDLKINPSILQFYNGSVYSWLEKTGVTEGNPMRLVKFTIGSK